MSNNVVLFRQRYRQQLQLILDQYRNRMDDLSELYWIINVRLPQHPLNSYYYHLNLAMAERKLKESRG